jgi:energy-coupling factor transporter ATP-binding protein EcfA2
VERLAGRLLEGVPDGGAPLPRQPQGPGPSTPRATLTAVRIGPGLPVFAPTIHRIRIEGFRRVQAPLELDLRSPKDEPGKTVVLAGPNGCGKTSVLEAVLLGLGQEGLIVRNEEKYLRDEHWRVTLPPGATIRLDVSFDGKSVESWERTLAGLFVRDAQGHLNAPGPDVLQNMRVEYFSSWRAPELVGAVKPMVGRGGRPSDREANRLWRLKQRINDERARGGYQATLAFADRARAWLEKINAAWARFHGSDDTTIDAQIANPDDEDLLADLYLVRDGKRVCSIDQVSSGEIELLSIAGWVILEGFDHGLLIIDEPELHLHPQWQATFLPALRELAPNAQFLVASHADAVWEQAYSFERFLLVDELDPRSGVSREANAATQGDHR